MPHGKYPEKVTPTNRTEAGQEVEGSLTSLYRKETFPRLLAFSASGPECPVELCFTSVHRSALHPWDPQGWLVWHLEVIPSFNGKSIHAEHGLISQVSVNTGARLWAFLNAVCTWLGMDTCHLMETVIGFTSKGYYESEKRWCIKVRRWLAHTSH